MIIGLLSTALAGELSETAVEALTAGSCNLCHDVEGIAAASRQESCHDCHVWIREVAADPVRRQKALAVFPLWERYEQSVASYLEVPDLEAAMARLEPQWVADWLADPHDVRPALPEGMPQFALSATQREAIAEAFAASTASVPATPAPQVENIAAGEALFVRSGCTACHSFGTRTAAASWPLAPDLAHTRDRMSADHIAAWIADPASVSEAATMPAAGLSAQEAILIRDFLVLSPLSTPAPPPVGPPPAPTTEPVTWAQVEERVFGRICVHCHMDPDQNQGRPGPGNGGGFGWAATGVELQTYAGVVAVADQLPEVLLRRREEARRDTLSAGHAPAALTRHERPGMPLGLPPLSDADLALVLGWIEQGMPQ